MTTEREHGHRSEALMGRLDYTDTRKEITYSDLERLCLEASEYGVRAVVVPSILTERAASSLRRTATDVSCFVGYPFGTQAASVKAIEAEEAVHHGAAEIEVVPHFGSILAGDWRRVDEELATIRAATGSAVLKLVLETSRLTAEQVERATRVAAEHGFAFVSNAIGFRIVSTKEEVGPAVTEAVVSTLQRASTGRLAVKIVGSAGTAGAIEALIRAGAGRIAVQAAPGVLRSLAREEVS
jgi:deoxyribose-phosphate aldolase